MNKYLNPIHLPVSPAPAVSPEPLRGFSYKTGIGMAWERAVLQEGKQLWSLN